MGVRPTKLIYSFDFPLVRLTSSTCPSTQQPLMQNSKAFQMLFGIIMMVLITSKFTLSLLHNYM